MESYQCLGCEKVKPAIRFAIIGKKGMGYRRKTCGSCAGKKGYQGKLSFQKFKGDTAIKECVICRDLFRNKKGEINKCAPCRRNADEINYWSYENRRMIL